MPVPPKVHGTNVDAREPGTEYIKVWLDIDRCIYMQQNNIINIVDKILIEIPCRGFLTADLIDYSMAPPFYKTIPL